MPENGARLDRIEKILESLAKHVDSLALRHVEISDRQTSLEQRQDAVERDFRHLLTAQVVMTETVEKLAQQQQATDARLRQLAEQTDARLLQIAESLRQHAGDSDERFTALTRMMDEWIRNNPRT